MPRYIDADKLEKYIADGLNNPNKKEAFGFDAVQILTEIYTMPTADVQEVKHGKWIQNKYLKRIFYCSVCGRCIEGDSESKNVSESFPYCHCGTKMDLEATNGSK